MEHHGLKVRENEHNQSVWGIRTLADVRHSNSNSKSTSGFDGFVSELPGFLRETWVDWATLAALGILTGGVRFLGKNKGRSAFLRGSLFRDPLF
jgi:hypothetical protein